MASDLNDLLEEGVTRCGELTDAADAALQAIDDAAEKARAAADRVDEEGREAVANLQALIVRLQGVEEGLTVARGDAQQALAVLAGRAETLGPAGEAGLNRIRPADGRLDEQRRRLQADLDERAASAQVAQGALSDQVQAADEQTARRLATATEAVARLRDGIVAARGALADRVGAWRTAIDELDQTAASQADAWVESLRALLQRQSEHLVDTANAMVDRHNDAMEQIQREFAEQAPEDLDTALAPLQATLARVSQESDERGRSLPAQATDLETAFDAQVALLDDLRASCAITAEIA
jgi:hypothetical protein